MCVLFVTLEHCGQTVGWIKMPLGMEVGLGPGDIVLDRDPAIPTERATNRVQCLRTQTAAHVCCDETVAHLSHC